MFTKRQQAELITSLQGRGEIPLKFAYLGAGATHWQRLSKKRSGGGINLQESNLLTKRMADFLKSFGHCSKINIFDLGCGDGSSIFPIIDELKNNDLTFRDYLK